MGKVVLVTGSAKGIGRSTAIEFAKNGYDVVINYRRSELEATLLKKEIESNYNVNVLSIRADVSNEDEVKQMISDIMVTLGRLDVVVNNAGIVYDRDFKDITADEFMTVLKVNVLGAFLVSREAFKYLKRGSSIVNVSSTNGSKVVSPDCLDYNISKVGLQSLTRDLAYQFKPNIRVNAVAIGWADTEMNSGLDKEYIDSETKKIYLNRFAEPEEIAKTIYFLASDNASYINGEIINIDGGY
jgi:3-oxoacyl-[acyl-carrier protein] reductase